MNNSGDKKLLPRTTRQLLAQDTGLNSLSHLQYNYSPPNAQSGQVGVGEPTDTCGAKRGQVEYFACTELRNAREASVLVWSCVFGWFVFFFN